MNPKQWVRARAAAMLACLLIAAAPAVAGPIVDWDPAYFYEAGATPINSSPGGQLFIVGTISNFGPPLNFLNASDPSKDYTFYVHGMISTGTVPTPVPPLGTYYTTNYTGGVIDIYEGTPRDAVFTPLPPNGDVPSTFINGTLILTGSVSNFYWVSNNFTAFDNGNAEGNITWTGGTLFSFISPQGQPCPSLFTGGTTWLPSLMIPGYLFRHEGKLDLDCPSPTRNSTWGRVKSLYR
jgi:hypothetical protein